MSAPNSSPPNTKRFKRKLTPFLCQEMLYDYAIDRLDADRKNAVDEFIKTDQESQRVLQGVRAGLDYARELSRTELRADVLAHLRESESAVSISKRYSSWKEWPDAFRWSVTAIVLSALIAGIVAIIPWSRIPSFKPTKRSDSIEIAEITKPSDKPAEPTTEEEPNAADEGSGDEEIEAPDNVADNGKPKAARPARGDEEGEEAGPIARPPVAANAKKPEVAVVAPLAKLGAPTPPAPPAAPTKVAAAAPVDAKNDPKVDAKDDLDDKKEAKPKGFVYRAFMTLPNLDELGPKIAENVTELGGEKAGEVELGWKRGTGRYYHFAMPEENEEKLLEKLRAYGPVRLSKDPHPRVMPKGQVRFILWVESAR